MATGKTVWGIDVGQSALKALKLRYRDNRLQAVSFDVIEHGKILSQPDADEQQLIRSALGKFLSRNNTKGSTIVVSVPGQASFTRFIKLPPVEPRKIPEIVRYEARQQIPFDLEDVVWDHQTISAPSAGPREVEVGIFAMKRDIVADYVSDFLAMKIEPDIVQMAPVALYNFLRYDKREGDGATVLLDVGAENTNLVIADGDRVWIRPVPIGGNSFTQALVKQFKLPFGKAENLKRHAAESKHARKVFQAMRPVFGDLVTEVQRSIGYYTSLHRDSRVSRVVALGNAFRLAGLRKYLAQNLGVEVEKVDGFNQIDDTKALEAPLFRENVLSFGVSFGLAVQGLGLATIGTSLLPPEILSQKLLKKKRPFFVGAAACLMGVVAAFGYNVVKTSGELGASPRQAQQKLQQARQLQQTNVQYQNQFQEKIQALKDNRQELLKLDDLLTNRGYAYNVLAKMYKAMPVARDGADVTLLQVSTTIIPDARTESANWASYPGRIQVVDPLAAEQAEAEPAEETDGEGAEPAVSETPPTFSGPVPGLKITIRGITKQERADALTFISNRVVGPLKEIPETVKIVERQTNVKSLVSIKGVPRPYGEQESMFLKYEGETPAADAKGAAEKIEELREKRQHRFFEVEWVVYMPEAFEATDADAAAGQGGQ